MRIIKDAFWAIVFMVCLLLFGIVYLLAYIPGLVIIKIFEREDKKYPWKICLIALFALSLAGCEKLTGWLPVPPELFDAIKIEGNMATFLVDIRLVKPNNEVLLFIPKGTTIRDNSQ